MNAHFMVFSRGMPSKKRSIDPLLKIMARLRSPAGCPWDREQDHDSIKQCLIEEAYEAVEAIESGDMETLCDELGDLLLQVVFHAQLARERKDFSFFDVVDRILEKLVRRHPHVFGKIRLSNSDTVLAQWEKIKADERKNAGKQTRSALDHIPPHLPALMRAEKLHKKAVKAGLVASGEQTKALKQAIRDLTRKKDRKARAKALGDVLFGFAGLAQKLKLEPEQLLRDANKRFEQWVGKRERVQR